MPDFFIEEAEADGVQGGIYKQQGPEPVEKSFGDMDALRED